MAAVVTLAALPAAASAAERATLRGSSPDWAKPSAQAGDVRGAAPQRFTVYLALRDSAGLDKRIAAVSDPSDPDYGRFLTPQQFRAQYAPTPAAVAAVRRYLRGAGFAVDAAVPANRRWLSARGTVAQVESAFHTQIRRYEVDGKVLPAPARDVTLPASVASRVAAITGLDGSDRLIKPLSATPDAPPSPGFANAPPCSTYFGEKLASDAPPAYGNTQPYVPCGYVPSQLQGAYGLKAPIAAGVDGRGQTVAIVDAFASPTIQADANTYAARHGLPPVSLTQQVPGGIYDVPEEGNACDPQGWYGEETLDVEAVHATAPRASILYAGARNCYDEALIEAVTGVLDGGRAQIISNSYGETGENVSASVERAWTDTFRQAAAQGVGVDFSSGDSGDEVQSTSGVRTVDFPASHPLVTAVGGTSLGVGRSDNYLFETGWGTTSAAEANGAWADLPGTFLYGSGGGTSVRYDEPSYQRPVVPLDIANYFGRRGRAVPDVSAVGDPNTGMLVGQTQTFAGGVRYGEYRLGGTSLSSPLFAGIMALADQRAGRRHGFANPALYKLYGSGAFRDPDQLSEPLAVVRVDYLDQRDPSKGTRRTLRTLGQTQSLQTRQGYDDVTGLGSPRGTSFLDALAPASR